MPPSPSQTADHALQRRAHLPRPASSIAAIWLFGAWIVVTLIVGSVAAADSPQDTVASIGLAVALRVAIATLGLVAILRGRAHPWGYYLGGSALLLLTTLPFIRLVALLGQAPGQEDTVVQGTLALVPLIAGLCIGVPFLFGTLSRFFYRVRRSRGRQR